MHPSWEVRNVLGTGFRADYIGEREASAGVKGVLHRAPDRALIADLKICICMWL